MRTELYAVTIPAGGALLRFRTRDGQGDVVPFRTMPTVEVVSGVGNGRAEVSGLSTRQCFVKIFDERNESVERFVRIRVSGGKSL